MAEPHVALDALRAHLREHWLSHIVCDHEAKTDIAVCSCSQWADTPHPSVAAAVDAWIEHALSSLPQQTAEPVATIEIFDGRSVLFAENGAFSLPNGTHKLYASSLVEVPETIVEDYIMGEFVSNVGFEAEAVRKFAKFLRSALVSSERSGREAIVCSVKTMKLSDGREEYYVAIRVGDREITPHKYSIKGRAEFDVAEWNWLLNGAEKPDVVDWLDRTRPLAALSQNPGTSNTSGEADDFLSTTRDTLGRKVREVWVAWARTQPQPKPSWLVPYDELSEPDKEADRRIGEAIWSAGRQDVYDTLRYCEVKWSEERGTMLDTIQTLRSKLAALEPRASDRERTIEECAKVLSTMCSNYGDLVKRDEATAAIRSLKASK